MAFISQMPVDSGMPMAVCRLLLTKPLSLEFEYNRAGLGLKMGLKLVAVHVPKARIQSEGFAKAAVHAQGQSCAFPICSKNATSANRPWNQALWPCDKCATCCLHQKI